MLELSYIQLSVSAEGVISSVYQLVKYANGIPDPPKLAKRSSQENGFTHVDGATLAQSPKDQQKKHLSLHLPAPITRMKLMIFFVAIQKGQSMPSNAAVGYSILDAQRDP